MGAHPLFVIFARDRLILVGSVGSVTALPNFCHWLQTRFPYYVDASVASVLSVRVSTVSVYSSPSVAEALPSYLRQAVEGSNLLQFCY